MYDDATTITVQLGTTQRPTTTIALETELDVPARWTETIVKDLLATKFGLERRLIHLRKTGRDTATATAMMADNLDKPTGTTTTIKMSNATATVVVVQGETRTAKEERTRKLAGLNPWRLKTMVTELYVKIPQKGNQLYAIECDLTGVDQITVLEGLKQQIRDREGFTCDLRLKKCSRGERPEVDQLILGGEPRPHGGSWTQHRLQKTHEQKCTNNQMEENRPRGTYKELERTSTDGRK